MCGVCGVCVEGGGQEVCGEYGEGMRCVDVCMGVGCVCTTCVEYAVMYNVWVCIFVYVICVVCMWCGGDCVGCVWDMWGFRNICVRVV